MTPAKSITYWFIMLSQLTLQPTPIHVFDIGSGIVRAGFSGEDLPKVVCLNVCGKAPVKAPTVVQLGQPQGVSTGKKHDIHVPVGAEVFKWVREKDGASTTEPWDLTPPIDWRKILTDMGPQKRLPDIIHPISHGDIDNWTGQKKVLDRVFQEVRKFSAVEQRKMKLPGGQPASSDDSLGAEDDDRPPSFLFSDPVIPNLGRREKLLQWAFETHRAAVVRFAPQPLMGLAGCGLDSGLVLDVGDGMTQIAAISETSIDTSASKCLPRGGRDVTRHLSQMLEHSRHYVHFPEDADVLEKLKKSFCFVSDDLKNDLEMARNSSAFLKTFKLPDGELVRMNTERFMIPELLFTPNLLGTSAKDIPGVTDAVTDVLTSLAVDTRLFFCRNIVLLGGTTLFKGFATRVREDIRRLYIDKLHGDEVSKKAVTARNVVRVDVAAQEHRDFMVFRGASLMAELLGPSRGFKGWITRAQYEERGGKSLALSLSV